MIKDPLPVMLEPVGNKDALSVGSFNQILQCLKLPVVNGADIVILIIHSAVRHLQELV